jgi:hypothetical protein
MAELIPLPPALLLRRAFHECRAEGEIFDLSKSKFFRGFPDLDLSVSFHGRRASTPLGLRRGRTLICSSRTTKSRIRHLISLAASWADHITM